jgi:hypothetical protein
VPEQAKLQKRFILYFLQLRVVSSNHGCFVNGKITVKQVEIPGKPENTRRNTR